MIQDYLAWKAALGESTGMSENLIHVHAGLAIFVVTALLLRQRMRSWIPLAFVIALAVANEVVDYYHGTRWDPTSSGMDLLNTILWPSVLFLLARRPGRSG